MPTEDVNSERDALLAEIDSAFAGVSRDGGISWTESKVVDNYGTPAECRAARDSDTDRSWTQLVDNPNWNFDPGCGGWAFLDQESTRYYLPAAMKRTVMNRDPELQGPLTLKNNDLRAEDWHMYHLLDAPQRTCVAHFLKYMINSSKGDELQEFYAGYWQAAYDSYWKQFG